MSNCIIDRNCKAHVADIVYSVANRSMGPAEAMDLLFPPEPALPVQTEHSPNCRRVWSRYDASCPRCRELAAGAEPRRGFSHRGR